MCGIFGIIVKDEQNLGKIMVEACKRLSYRGYDSVGAGVLKSDGTTDLRKDVGKVDEVSTKLNLEEMEGVIGIAQLRWATFGAPSQINAQPHYDSEKKMIGAHNGNIVNNIQLKEVFKNDGMIVRSTNDGESCVHAVEYFVKRNFPMEESVRKSMGLLEGDYSFLIASVYEKKLYAVKKGSGLVVGLGRDGNYVSSDLPSLLFLTKKVIKIDDGEMVILEPDKVTVKNIETGKIIDKEIEEITEEMESVKKGGFPHFMLKEIYEQPKVASDLLHLLNASSITDKYLLKLKNARNIYFIGCGTSYHACLFGAVAFSKYAKRAVIPVLAPQFIPQYLPTVTKDDVGIFVSQSGETKDVLKALYSAKEQGMGILALVNVLGSTLMKESEVYLPLACGYEISVPATKTFTNQLIAFVYLALKLGGKDTKYLSKIPELLEETIKLSNDIAKRSVKYFKDFNEFYCLGYGLSYPIALEGALKIKEVTYTHCEGMLSTEFKHGPLSSVREGYPVLFVVSPEDIPLALSGINEVSCRGGFTIVISKEDEKIKANCNEVFVLRNVEEPLFSLTSVIPLQLLSYYSSVDKGIDPDFPRNLSKTLTVD
jgi:glucosamine--fructose-6-phosphate aminotransferase (isomerizing)